jgi:hypothetical protein
MNALCAIDSGLLSANGLLTPEPPTNLAVNYTITIPLDSDPDLVLHYPFNQNILNYGSSTSLSTNLGPNTGVADATIVSSSGSTVSLSSNQSIFNNGTSLYQSASNNTSYLSIPTMNANSNGYSFSLWVYFTSISTSRIGVIFSFTTGTSDTDRIVFYTDSFYSNTLIFSCNNTTNIVSSIYPVLNTWYHYVWTLDKNNNNRIYVNGVLQVTATTPSYVSFTPDNNSIFGDKPFPNYGSQGYMNDFRYYNRILDSAEVFQLYNIYSLRFNSGLQWQSFYGNQISTGGNITYLPTSGSFNSFQYNAYYSGGNNNSLSSNSSNLLTTINYGIDTIAVANNIFGFSNLAYIFSGSIPVFGSGRNIGLLVYGYFRPNISGVWNLNLYTDNFCALWFNDGSGGSSFWPPTDTNHRIAITSGDTNKTYNTASLIAGTYYPFQITWSQLGDYSIFIFSFKHNTSGTFITNGTGYFFSEKPTTPIYTDLSLVLYYPFDQNIYNYASGFPVLNSNFTGTNNNIKINNTTYKVGNGSLQKDSSNSSQYVYFNTIPQNTGGYSFAFWFNFTSLITTGTFFSFGDGNNNNIKITSNRSLDSSGIILSIKSIGGIKFIKTNYYPTISNWNHYVWTLDKNHNSNFYVNGVLQTGFPKTDISYVSFAMNTNTNFILADDLNGAASVMGYLDDFRYYNSILTPTTIASLSNNQVSNFPVFAETLNTRLVLYYPFNGDIKNYASGTGVNDGATITAGGITLVNDNYIVGTGSLYKAVFLNNASYFNAADLSANTGGYSFSLWLKFVDPSYGMIFSFADLSNSNRRIYFYNVGDGSNLRISCNNVNNNISNTFPSLNTWNHYVWTLDTGSNNCFYINGELASGFPNVSIPYASFAMNFNYIFGDTTDNYIDIDISGVGQQGYVDDFRYYNRILTQSEVTQLFNMYIPSKVSSDNLTLYYPFNTDISNYASGTGVTNGSVNGTVSLNTTIYIIGIGSLRQSASNTTSRFSVNQLTPNANGYTFSLWFYFTSTTESGTIFSFANNLNSSTRITFANTGSNLSISCNGSSISNLPLPSTNTWTHYAWTLDTNSNSNFYINGVLRPGFPTQTIPYASFEMNHNYILGDTSGGNGQQGYVDDFRYYNSILNQQQVYALYNMRGPTTSSQLILHYPFDGRLNNYGLSPTTNSNGGTVLLNNTNYIIGTGSLYQSTSNNTSFFQGILTSSHTNISGYSFSLWLYLTSDQSGMIFSFDNCFNVASQRLYLYNVGDGSNLRISNDGSTNDIPNTFPILNTWTHYVWSVSTNDIHNIYINGVREARIASTPRYTNTQKRRIVIFGDSLRTSEAVNGAQGYIDDFRYYDGVLGQGLISALYNIKGPINTPKLILYYPFNTDISNYASGTGVNFGTIDGSTISRVSTNYIVGTGSLYQSASNTTSYFSIPIISNNNIAGFSFSLWIYFYSLNNGMIFTFAAGTGTNNNRIFVSLFSNTIRIGYNAPQTDTSKNTLITPNLNTWYHYAWTLNTNSNNNFYVNGVPLYISNTPAYLSAPLNINRILGSNTTGAPPTNGAQAYVDDFRYYDGILSPMQVTDLYNLKNPQNFNPNTDSSLCIYYPFDICRNYVVNYAASVYGVIDASYVNGAVVDYTTNKVGTGALKLISGNSQYVQLNSNSIVQTTNFISSNGMTFSLWIDSSGTLSNTAIFYFRNDVTDYIGLFINNNNSISCKVYNNQNSTVDLNTDYNNRIWRHVVWTLGYSPSNTSRWNIYIDGIMVSSTSNNYYPSTTDKTTRRLGSDSGNNYYNGWIDDFRVYQRVLNQLEVTQLYNYQDTSANFPTLNANTPNFSWTPPERKNGVSYNYYTTDNTLNTSSTTINTKATNVLIPEINIDNSNSYYVNSQRSNKQSVYANITI